MHVERSKITKKKNEYKTCENREGNHVGLVVYDRIERNVSGSREGKKNLAGKNVSPSQYTPPPTPHLPHPIALSSPQSSQRPACSSRAREGKGVAG